MADDQVADLGSAIVCYGTVVGPTIGIGAASFHALGAVVGALVGLAVAPQICAPGKPLREKLRSGMERQLKTTSSSAHRRLVNVLVAKYGVPTGDAEFLANLAVLHVRRRGELPEHFPGGGHMQTGIRSILRRSGRLS